MLGRKSSITDIEGFYIDEVSNSTPAQQNTPMIDFSQATFNGQVDQKMESSSDSSEEESP